MGRTIHGQGGSMNGTTKKGKKIQIKFAPLRGLLSACNIIVEKFN
jgi:hypothetical protein